MEDKSKVVLFAVVALLIGAAAGAGVGFMVAGDGGDSAPGGREYSFYLHFADGDSRDGWYSATAEDAGQAFGAAMDAAGLEHEVSSYGYVASIDGVDGGGSGWYICHYVYSDFTEEAAKASILFPTESFGTLQCSKGWKSLTGYGEGTEVKLAQVESTAFFLSPYALDPAPEGSPASWSAPSPVTVKSWMSGGPFAS